MKLIPCAALAMCLAAPAFASQTVTLDFEGAPGYVNSIGSFYAGGTDGEGHAGPNYGISFSDAAVGLTNDGDFHYFSNAPTPGTALFAFDDSAVMNVTGGFFHHFAFYYSSPSATSNAVNIYSGLNGTGTLLASVSLSANAQSGCSDDTGYCHFDLATVDFDGKARSVSFGGDAPNVLYDNISLAPVPEPETYLLLAAGLAAVGVARRRRDVA